MASQPNERLDSWKEISAYLNRDERTAMRWAKERGLPVHRLPGPGRSGVFAYVHEVDAWVAGQSEPLANASRAAARRSWLGNKIVLGAMSAVILVAATLLIFAWTHPGPPQRISFSGNKIQAWDRKGQLAWEYQFSEPVRGKTPQDWHELARRARLVDLFGDGRQEVLAIVSLAPNQAEVEVPRDALYCFTSKGKLLWNYDPKMSLSFGGRKFEAPWRLYDMVVSTEPGPKTIWLAVAHHLWGKSFVARMDAQGHATVQFVNSGGIYSLNRVTSHAGSFLWIGAFNDEYDRGSLAIMRDDQPFGSSPQTPGSRYACDDCPPGSPSAYFLFPRYELNRFLKPGTNEVGMIVAVGDTMEVSTFEVSPGDRVIYTFSRGFFPTPLRVGYASTFPKLHQQLENEGKITHRFSDCPEILHPPALRVWRDSVWQTAQVPSDFTQQKPLRSRQQFGNQ
jgi:hypothetical protein